MTPLIAPMDVRGCSAEARLEGDVIIVRLLGSAEADVLESLDEFIERLHEAVRATGTTKVRVELDSLHFMSSSCLKSLVRWLVAVEDLGQSGRYAVTFVSNPTSHWQRRSLRALQTLAPQIVALE